MGLFKKEKSKSQMQRDALKSTLRLLVMLREMLSAEGARDTDLHKSVVAHANMIGQCLPEKDLLSQDEVRNIKALIAGSQAPTPSASFELPKVPGQMVILDPRQLQRPK